MNATCKQAAISAPRDPAMLREALESMFGVSGIRVIGKLEETSQVAVDFLGTPASTIEVRRRGLELIAAVDEFAIATVRSNIGRI